MDRQPSDKVGSENLHVLQNLKRIPRRKEIDVESLQSSQKDFSVVNARSTGRSSKHRVFDGTRSFKYFKNIDTKKGKLPLTDSGASGNSDKDRQVLQACKIEQLSARLKTLEEEIGTIRQEFFEHVKHRKSLLNYIRQQFRVIHCRLHQQDNQVNGEMFQQELDCQPGQGWKTGYCLIRSSMHRLNSM